MGGQYDGKLVWYFGAELIAVSNPGNVNKYNAARILFVGFTTLPQLSTPKHRLI
jgi:hypothetical protein